MGKVTRRTAEIVCRRVEYLVSAMITGNPLDDDTARWVASIDDVLAGRLAAVGLLAPRASTHLKGFLDAYVKGRIDVKPTTKQVYGHTRRNLVEYFGPTKPLRSITPGDADDWRRWLSSQGLSENTVRRRTGIAKQFFRAASRKDLIRHNPFEGLASAVRSNPARVHFVTREVADTVLDACPDTTWRVIFALSRFGGLRCPSEHLLLRWTDIDWEGGRIRVTSPKTERHVDGQSREIPLFAELRPILERGRDEATSNETHVITRYRSSAANLRTMLVKILRRAGIEPWPKLFQNLRASRQTELAEDYPLHVACAWIGNTQAVAQKHYLQVTDEHFAKAADRVVRQR